MTDETETKQDKQMDILHKENGTSKTGIWRAISGGDWSMEKPVYLGLSSTREQVGETGGERGGRPPGKAGL